MGEITLRQRRIRAVVDQSGTGIRPGRWAGSAGTPPERLSLRPSGDRASFRSGPAQSRQKPAMLLQPEAFLEGEEKKSYFQPQKVTVLREEISPKSLKKKWMSGQMSFQYNINFKQKSVYNRRINTMT